MTLREPVPEAVWSSVQADIGDRLRAIDGYLGVRVVRIGADRLVLLVFGTDAAALDRIAAEVGGPWVQALIAPHLAGPPQRQVGEVVVDLAR